MQTGKMNITKKDFDSFTRVCASMVEEADADILFGSEVGDFGMGMKSAASMCATFCKGPSPMGT